MNGLVSLLKYELQNLARVRWLMPYALIIGGLTTALLRFSADPSKAVLSLQSVVLLVLPMVAGLYSTIYWYNAESFTALLLTQPMPRRAVYLARWFAISLGLSASFAAGSGVAFLVGGITHPSAALLILIGAALTMAFSALGMLIAVTVQDRMKGIGLTFVLWLYCALLHDAIIFLVLSGFKEYPIELPGLVLLMVNPIDLGRLALLLSLDQSAMMSYTGRILQRVLSGPGGFMLAGFALTAWIIFPLAGGLLAFRRKDL